MWAHLQLSELNNAAEAVNWRHTGTDTPLICRDHDWESKNAFIILTKQSLLEFPESKASEVVIDEAEMTLTRHGRTYLFPRMP